MRDQSSNPGNIPPADFQIDADLDRRLDAALATYADPGETVNTRLLTARVLALASTTPPNRTRRDLTHWRRRWPWILTAPALAALLLLIIAHRSAILSHWSTQTPRARAFVKQPPQPTPTQHNPATVPASAAVSDRRSPPPHNVSSPQPTVVDARTRLLARAAQPVKQDVFPTPKPLTDQEKLLIAFLAHASPKDRQAIARFTESAEPLLAPGFEIDPFSTTRFEIAPFQIAALNINH
jgi:hypothetical protein